ncbi:NAD(P)H-dependent oxidoreductase [Paenibacillus sp. KACC 21273]|uniref:NAD(P)H-dependent oxidoreductase n=1 Tax=Paenibacillus sp. KACC 21273 TaxID=3025665 RepID=UPI00236704B8|nr:NAD(P)H-dependent oxidoreductase [Paenibacillus sp. KACC 21273]WDF51352.1 NAD(P)H-dependent oxidoreductase [Paenibacillus sp. KACC 21273]
MKHLIVFAHPHQEGTNQAILKRMVQTLESQGHEVVVRDLYALNFQPVLTEADTEAMKAGNTPADIKAEQEYITAAEVITFVYPIWWTGLPAILKGYVDRVFAYGFAYGYEETGVAQLLTGKKGLIINTHGQTNEIYDQVGMTDGLKITSTTGIFGFVGIESVGHLIFGGAPYADEAQLENVLRQVEETVTTAFNA